MRDDFRHGSDAGWLEIKISIKVYPKTEGYAGNAAAVLIRQISPFQQRFTLGRSNQELMKSSRK
jgi:hypothetical protein